MLKIKINHAKTYLPSSMIKGSTEQRLLKARLLNLKFHDELQDSFRDKEVAPRTFAQILKKVSHKNLMVEILPSTNEQETMLYHRLNSKGVNEGYALQLPVNYFSGKIHKNSAKYFLEETQNFFNEIFNPKFFKRNLALINKLPKNKNVIQFYKKSVSGTANLTTETLEKFLSGIKQNQTQIDVLQLLRYKLLAEQNTAQAKKQIDKSIEKHSGFTYIRPENFYSLEKYNYEKKLEVITQKLLKLINKERTLNC